MKKNSTILYKALLVAACCLTGATLLAQHEYSIKNFNTDNGLPQNEITAMSMDYSGYLWLGTRNGLVRYDGNSLKTFLFEKDNYWANVVLTLMNFPSEKKLAVKTRSSSTFLIKNAKPVLNYQDTTHNDPDGINGYFPSHTLFLNYNRTIVNLTAKLKWTGSVREVVSVNDKDFIVGCVGHNELVYFRKGIAQTTDTIAGKLKKFLLMGKYRFLVNEKNRMYLYDSNSKKIKETGIDWTSVKDFNDRMDDGSFFSDPFSGQSFFFYNTTFYLLSVDPGSNLVRFHPQFSIKDKKHIWTGITYNELQGMYFLSTDNEGFFEVKLHKIKTFNITERLPKNTPAGNAINYAVLKTSDSTAIIPTGFQFTATATVSSTKIEKLGNIFGERQTIGMLSDGSIICPTTAGLCYYSPKDGYLKKHVFNDSFNHQNTEQIMMIQPEGDSVWISTNSKLYCLTKEKVTIVADMKKNGDKDDDGFLFFYRINEDEVFLCGRAGLYKLHTGASFRIDPLPLLKGKHPCYISAYKNVYILSVYFLAGLYVLKDDKVYKVPLPDDLPELGYCHSTHIDSKDGIWIVTDRGLFKSTASSVLESALNGGSTPFFYYYGKDDGIANTEFNGGGFPNHAELAGKYMYYPSMEGIVSFNTEEMNVGTLNAPVTIEDIIIDNKKKEQPTDSIRLKPDFKYLVIGLSTSRFGDPKNLSVEYNLDNSGWTKIAVTDNLKITLVDIASGNHHLSIRRRTGFGNTDYAYTNLAIHREKSIFEQGWFYLLLMFAVGLIFLITLHVKTRNINRKRASLQKLVDKQTAELSQAVEIKDLLISIISHDMVAPLRHISLIANVLGKGLETDPQKANEALFDIKVTSDRILSGSTSILNWMKYNNKQIRVEKKLVNLYGLVNDAFARYASIASSKNIELANEVPKSTIVAVDYNVFITILGNIISNSIKYSVGGTTRVYLEPGPETKVKLKITDTGIGMNTETIGIVREVLKGNLHAIRTTSKINTGLGYILVSELLKIHELIISIDSTEGEGTTVSIPLT